MYSSVHRLDPSASRGDDSTVTIVVIVVGIIFGIVAVGMTSYCAKRELNRIAEIRQAEMDHENGADNEGMPAVEASSDRPASRQTVSIK